MIISDVVVHQPENYVPKVTSLHEKDVVFVVSSQLADVLSQDIVELLDLGHLVGQKLTQVFTVCC